MSKVNRGLAIAPRTTRHGARASRAAPPSTLSREIIYHHRFESRHLSSDESDEDDIVQLNPSGPQIRNSQVPAANAVPTSSTVTATTVAPRTAQRELESAQPSAPAAAGAAAAHRVISDDESVWSYSSGEESRVPPPTADPYEWDRKRANRIKNDPQYAARAIARDAKKAKEWMVSQAAKRAAKNLHEAIKFWYHGKLY